MELRLTNGNAPNGSAKNTKIEKRTVATNIALTRFRSQALKTILRAMSTTAATTTSTALHKHIAEQTYRLIHLLESINYPHELSPEAIHAQLADQYSTATPGDLTSDDFDTTPASLFVDWLLDNVTAESNWPGYDNPTGTSVSIDHADREIDEEEGEQALAALDQQHWQLQNTLASLEKELEDMKILESQATDTNRLMDMDIHDTSIKLDATAAKLESTARKVSMGYLGRGQGGNYHMDTSADSGRTQPNTFTTFLYQCEEDLDYIRQLDMAFIETSELLYNHILSSFAPPLASTSSAVNSAPSHSLERLLKRNPSHEQEIVRLCSTYRATKMSHIRAVAQLKCLEEELQYMKSLDTEARQRIQEEEAAEVENRTGDYSLYTIASSNNLLIQKSRQQEIELISIQRETTRLKDETEQLLSDPEQPRTSGLLSQSQDAGEDHSTEDVEDMARRGVLVDLCERIARCDIELPFLVTVHEDSMREHGQALKELDQTFDRLLEYYCLGVVVEQTLEREKEAIQSQKDLLWAAVSECQDLQMQSSRLHGIAENRQRQSQGRPQADSDPVAMQKRDADLIMQLLNRNAELRREGEEEQRTLQEHLQELTNAKDLLNHHVLRQHSSTNQVLFVPRVIHDLKDKLSQRTRHLQQEHTLLKDTVQQIVRNQHRP
ncbi:hypothetical protein BGZ96_012633 [Linnemannia gamsii]|uniref:Up-regulated during septation protein 1 domain-containing protein n=1 Tax=Linnemannia gamsii TaxID=64522 RepID=A0ABQ7KB71_9FUNG|nr:hypothetical protein BGZ96_012633 [Linnemannia gamsii]